MSRLILLVAMVVLAFSQSGQAGTPSEPWTKIETPAEASREFINLRVAESDGLVTSHLGIDYETSGQFLNDLAWRGYKADAFIIYSRYRREEKAAGECVAFVYLSRHDREQSSNIIAVRGVSKIAGYANTYCAK